MIGPGRAATRSHGSRHTSSSKVALLLYYKPRNPKNIMWTAGRMVEIQHFHCADMGSSPGGVSSEILDFCMGGRGFEPRWRRDR